MANELTELTDVVTSVELVAGFIRGPYYNLWVEDSLLSVYLRKGLHCQPITGQPRRCLDVANINVVDTGRGTFSAWIEKVEILAREEGFEALWVENVATRKFATWFRQRPQWIETSGFAASFMLLLAKDNNVNV